VSCGIFKLAGNANTAAVKAALSNLDKCVGELATLADVRESPAVMAISMVPNVGSVMDLCVLSQPAWLQKFPLRSRPRQQRTKGTAPPPTFTYKGAGAGAAEAGCLSASVFFVLYSVRLGRMWYKNQ
jgi:hypothetical protein